jgi:hypothetical protein
MGFSLIGNSGDQKTSTNVYETTETADLNPQIDQEGSGAGALGLNISPNFQGGAGGDVSTTAGSYYAPVNITSTGDNLGDSALAAVAGISGTQSGDDGVATAPTTLSSLLSGNTIYWIIGALVLLFLAHE